jgi:hypothetical protein
MLLVGNRQQAFMATAAGVAAAAAGAGTSLLQAVAAPTSSPAGCSEAPAQQLQPPAICCQGAPTYIVYYINEQT